MSEYVCFKIKQIELLTTCFHEIAYPNLKFSVIFSQAHSFEKATIKQTRITLIGWKKLENSEIGNSRVAQKTFAKSFIHMANWLPKMLTH